MSQLSLFAPVTPPRTRSALLPKDWDWQPAELICDVVTECKCEDGEVKYRAKLNGELLFNREDFSARSLIASLRQKGYIP
jgi:hypothetical protein